MFGELLMRISVVGALLLVTACVPLADQQRDLAIAAVDTSVAVPVALRVEGRDAPIGVGRSVPRLSWRSSVPSQSAYEIEVASSAEALDANRRR